MYRVKCAEVWGGTQDADMDVRASGLRTSLYSVSSDGGKGGDIYYFAVCSHDALSRIVVADVVGHGAAINTISKWLYDALVAQRESLDGNAVLTNLNRTVSDHGFDALTTAAVVTFYVNDSNLYFSYAGHPPLLMRRRNEITWRAVNLQPSVKPTHLPLGVLPNTTYQQEHVPLAAGDRLFLYTDGVIEAPDSDDDLFGETRLIEALERTGDKDLNEVKQEILAAVRAHTGGSLAHDDLTMLVIEVS